MARSIVQLDLLSPATLKALQEELTAKRGFVDDATWGIMTQTLNDIEQEIETREDNVT